MGWIQVVTLRSGRLVACLSDCSPRWLCRSSTPLPALHWSHLWAVVCPGLARLLLTDLGFEAVQKAKLLGILSSSQAPVSVSKKTSSALFKKKKDKDDSLVKLTQCFWSRDFMATLKRWWEKAGVCFSQMVLLEFYRLFSMQQLSYPQ